MNVEQVRNNFGLSDECSDEVGLRSSSIDEALLFYAKQESIAFAEWIKDNYYTRNLSSGDERWYKYFSVNKHLPCGAVMSSGVSEYFTTEQLYSLYQQQSKNKQP